MVTTHLMQRFQDLTKRSLFKSVCQQVNHSYKREYDRLLSYHLTHSTYTGLITTHNKIPSASSERYLPALIFETPV
jgi:hypothetical protein